MAGGAVVTGVTAYFVGAKIVAAPVGGRRGCSPNDPIVMPRSSAAAKQIAALAPVFRKEWADIVGGEMPPAALEIAFSQAMLESGIDTWWTNRGPGSEWANGPKGQAFFAKFPDAPPQGNMIGSNNLGARQCGKGDAGGADYICVPYGDSVPDAQGVQHPIQASFRYYKTPEAGARDFIYSITKQWPAVAELKAGDVLGYVMRQGPKYRGDDKPNQTVFGLEYKGGNGYYGGFGATMEERVGGYGKAIRSHLPMVAAALGHDRIYACVAPELMGAKGKYLSTAGVEGDAEMVFAPGADGLDSSETEFAVEGAGVIIAATVISAIAAAIVGAVVTGALKDKAENDAADVVKKLREVGIDYIDPGAEPRKGWLAVQSNDPRLLKALDFLGGKRDRVLQSLAAKGFGFQAQPRIRVPARVAKGPTTRGHEQSHAQFTDAQARADWTPAAEKALEACIKRGGDLIDCGNDPSVVSATKNPDLVFAPATADEASRRTFQGEADVTPEAAAASNAYAKASVEGVAATVAIAAGVVAAGLAAGAGVAAIVSKVADAADPIPPPAASPPAPAPAPGSAPPAKPAPRPAPAPKPAAKPRESVAADEGVTAYKQPRAKGEPESPAEEPSFLSSLLSSDDDETVSAKRAPRKVQGFETGEALQALYLSGALPRARAIPGTDGAVFVWYIEPPALGASEPSDAAKATSTAFDVSDIVKSVTNIVDAGDSIARRYKKDDPKCLVAVRAFVEKHPLITRWFAPEMKAISKVGIGYAGPGDAGMFADRYVDELLRQRETIGEASDCEPTADEDRAVLGALMVPLGLSKAEEDAIYTAASRTAATALDLYAPGSGGRASEASDAISALITGRQMAPRAPVAATGKPNRDDATAKCRAQLDAERDKVSVAKSWADRHPWLAALTSPDLRKLSGRA